MNPQWHDEFVVFCSLYASGELTEEEWAHLQVHLAYCESCRILFDQYEQLADNVIPVLAASAASTEMMSEPSSFSLEDAERKLMERLDALPQEGREAPRKHLLRNISLLLLAACALCMAGLAGLHFGRSGPQAISQKPLPQQDGVIAASLTKPAATDNSAAELAMARTEVAELDRELHEAEDHSRQSSSVAAAAQQQLASVQAERKSLSDERDALNQQLTAARSDADVLRMKAADEGAARRNQGAQIAALEVKLNELNSTIEEKDRVLAINKGLLDHDREIRDLIGARDLYIADIFDVAQTGKTAEPFGRVFYTKDRSLVFYGYDLDKQAGLKKSVAFQAWGSGDDKQNVSLGLFYQDDSHKRWILRFNDTKTLARLNMVFVTAEPQGGSVKPTGKPLLLAYLQVHPNHP